MSKKNFLILIPLIAIIGVTAVYNYSRLSDRPENQINNVNDEINVNEQALHGPKISVAPPSYDLGTVKYEEGANYTFKIQNKGDESLEILRLSTSCGCTKATMDEDEKNIPPGGSADLFVDFEPSVHKDDSDLGEILRIVYIKSNDPQNPETEVEIVANVIK